MRSRRTLLIVVSVVLIGIGALLLAVNHFAQPQQRENPVTGDIKALFAASYPDLQGQSQSLQQWQGHVLVVNFWASWCPPCRDEMPEFSAMQDHYRQQGLVVIGISTDDVVKMQEFARQSPVSYPLLAGEGAGMDLSISLGNDQQALPYTLVVRRDGSIASSRVGRIDLEALESTIRPLL